MKIIVLGITDQTASRAIPAIGRASIGYKEQHPIRIAMHQARHGRMGIFAHGIQHLLTRNDYLPRSRDHLLANRAFRIVAIDQIEEVRRDRHGQLLAGMLAARHFVPSQIDQRFELLEGRYAVPKLPSPILPI